MSINHQSLLRIRTNQKRSSQSSHRHQNFCSLPLSLSSSPLFLLIFLKCYYGTRSSVCTATTYTNIINVFVLYKNAVLKRSEREREGREIIIILLTSVFACQNDATTRIESAQRDPSIPISTTRIIYSS